MMYIDPKLLAHEADTMMPIIGKELSNISTDEGKITYARQKLLEYLTAKNITKVLAFVSCFEGNTGERLNIEDLYINDSNSLTKNVQYITEDTILSDAADNLSGIINIFFPE